MAKKLLLALVAVLVVAGGVAALSAYEAHIINVTARIENALEVTPDEILFGTVFPQEYLEQEITICTSDSFADEPRVDDVNYFIRQKPKCGWTLDEGQNLLGIPTMTGHYDEETGEITCPDSTWKGLLPEGAVWGPLPLLCPYLSKHKAERDSTMATDKCVDPNPPSGDPYYDCGVDAFHEMGTDAFGHVVKSVNDDCDVWVIDLDVPCFDDHCAQDWTHQGWELDPEDESKVFGCDLWIEVTGISEWIE
jgi:hypothetical protein